MATAVLGVAIGYANYYLQMYAVEPYLVLRPRSRTLRALARCRVVSPVRVWWRPGWLSGRADSAAKRYRARHGYG